MSDKPMTQEELAEIRDLAEKAMPGSWEDVAACLECPREVGISRQDLAYIAAANPKTVLALLDEVKRLREEVARLDKESDWFIEYIWNKDIFRCPMPEGYKCEHKFKHICCLDSEETEIRGRCWREAARKAVEDENG
ncbi:ead/Ea22-like family protein [Desulfovibrio piger]|uniref:ead/Ea22-like family protein n=1 Tax=Desulfovibrio piger TaxID=901 RepID=UPI0026F0709F|nr:ead/Ea22-like family protein [Desulfovibrio piger]